MMRVARRFIILNLTIAVAFCGSSVWSTTQKMENGCLSCHEEVCQKGVSNYYSHSPFEKGECGVCHLRQEGAIKRESVSTSKRLSLPDVLHYPDYATDHTIMLKGLIHEATYDISVTFKDLSGNEVRKEFGKVIPTTIPLTKTDDKKPPVIFGVKVGPVEKATFLATTISWHTDESATSFVEYGLSGQYGERGAEDVALVKRHQASIHELEPGKDYHFRVISRDIYGNEAVSENYMFSTARISEDNGASEKGDSEEKFAELDVEKAEIFLMNSNCCLY